MLKVAQGELLWSVSVCRVACDVSNGFKAYSSYTPGPIVHPSVRLSVHLLTLSNDISSKAIEAICPYLGKNVAWLGGFKK